ncbi:MAG: 1-acyl-sn-glycerol-3-phosphate acyltransferase [Solibacterales bacterium]|nr:1-acyl-sn-glycerol-3-phosphate acyltransferase [Bryobacterales bacterium]|tara:strand:+ start:755 stop:1474 length:720 start_codon:yes stop_codon:yes gene_type:complete
MSSLHWWRTVFFLIPAIGLYTILLGTCSLGLSLFDKRGYSAHWCARTWAWLILRTTGVQVDVEGLERLTPGRTYVFVSNHQSIYDIPVIFSSIPYQLRIIAKRSLGRIPFLGWHLRRTGHMLVDRTRPGKAVFGWASRLTSGGLSLIVFPEGTRSLDGKVGRFKGGSFHLALEAGISVVPVSIIESRHIMLKGRLMVQPGKVKLLVHEPIETASLANVDPREFAEQVRETVRKYVELDF